MDKNKFIEIAKTYNSKITEKIESDKFEEKYRSDSSFTPVFKEEMCKILKTFEIKKYKKEFYIGNLEYFQKEKLTVDITVWESKYDGNILKINRKDYPKEANGYEWKYLCLIEHENSGLTWLHEMQKLCTLYAPYKLIITYGRTLENDNGYIVTKDKKGIQLLKHAEQILENIGNKNFKEFIIMFGEENENLDKLGNRSVYDIYRYSKEKSIFEKFEY